MSFDALAQFQAVRADEGQVAMATLVSATGTSSSIVGAKTFVGATGHIVGSVTIGGCIDARAVEAADRVLTTGQAELIDVALADEDAWDMGLACGGAVRLLVEAVANAAEDPVTAAYTWAAGRVNAGQRALVVRRLDGGGARLLVGSDGGYRGTLGDPAADARVAPLAAARGAAAPCIIQDAAGGQAYFVESFAPPCTVAIFGAGEVAVVLTRIVHDLGMRVVIVDARARYATAVRFPQADDIRVGDVAAIAAALRSANETYVVIVSHDYKFELPVLRRVLRMPFAYVGLMSSRKRGGTLRQVLADEGFTPEELSRIHTPIGLKIGARMPAEVAVAIAGELVAERAARRASAGGA